MNQKTRYCDVKKKHDIPLGNNGDVMTVTETLSVCVSEDYDEFVFDTFGGFASKVFHTRQIMPKEIIIRALIEFKKNHPEVWEAIITDNDLRHGRKVDNEG